MEDKNLLPRKYKRLAIAGRYESLVGAVTVTAYSIDWIVNYPLIAILTRPKFIARIYMEIHKNAER